MKRKLLWNKVQNDGQIEWYLLIINLPGKISEIESRITREIGEIENLESGYLSHSGGLNYEFARVVSDKREIDIRKIYGYGKTVFIKRDRSLNGRTNISDIHRRYCS